MTQTRADTVVDVVAGVSCLDDPPVSMADLPFACGDKWIATAESNEVRDEIIAGMGAAGITAALC